MLSVAVAKELSLSNRTLIVDLDFFNRGLTGLMGDGPASCEIDKPGFLLEDESEATIKWKIVQVAENLFHIAYPDLLPEEMQRFETLDVNVLRASLEAFIRAATEKCNCACVVLDCHGGPDNSSFAACLFADYSILVSEPDRITFYGTLNFLRQLKRIGGESAVNLHLVFNKVVPAFSGLFLRSLYNRLIKEHFANRPLLAIFPLEVYLTKEFEKTPFLTAVYPASWLARKTRTLLYDLLANQHKEKLPRAVRTLPKWMRGYTKLSLGRQIPIFNMNVVMSAIVIVVVMIAFVTLSLSQFYRAESERILESAFTIETLQCIDAAGDLKKNRDDIDLILFHRSDRLAFYTLTNRIDRERYNLYDELETLRPYFSESNRTFVNHEKLLEYRRKSQALDNKEKELDELQNCLLKGEYGYYYYRDLDIRSRTLRNLNPTTVPSEYTSLYERHVFALQNTSRLYRLLQRAAYRVSESGKSLAVAGAGWLALVLLINWSILLDRRFTYYSRLRRFASAAVFYFIAIALWFLPLLVVMYVAVSVLRKHVVGLSYWLMMTAAIVMVAILVSLVAGQLIRSYREIRYERYYIEPALRAIFAIYLAMTSAASYFLFRR